MWFMHRVMLHGAALALPALLATQALSQGTQPKEPDRTTGSGVRMEEPSVPPAPNRPSPAAPLGRSGHAGARPVGRVA